MSSVRLLGTLLQHAARLPSNSLSNSDILYAMDLKHFWQPDAGYHHQFYLSFCPRTFPERNLKIYEKAVQLRGEVHYTTNSILYRTSGLGDHGLDRICAFMREHKCNHICKALGLDELPSPEDWEPRDAEELISDDGQNDFNEAE